MFRNQELRKDLTLFAVLSVVLAVAGFLHSVFCGAALLIGSLLFMAIHFRTEYLRYRRIAGLSADLDALLQSGTPLPIGAYSEGELSILANQIQKVTLQLMESKEILRTDKLHLADSLADISHQLRTPLTAMNLTAVMLNAEDLTEERRSELTMELRGLLSRVDWLVESLLKLSKLDAGVVTMEKKAVLVSDLIDRATAPLSIPMDLRDQRLIVNCHEEQFRGDVIWSAEALGNIVKNCIEHTQAGGSITIRAEETALYTQITVDDTGPGFDAADIPHLFERFYKGSNASENSYGIGLALARNIITAQNGRIQARNSSTGAQFIIRFYKQVI